MVKIGSKGKMHCKRLINMLVYNAVQNGNKYILSSIKMYCLNGLALGTVIRHISSLPGYFISTLSLRMLTNVLMLTKLLSTQSLKTKRSTNTMINKYTHTNGTVS